MNKIIAAAVIMLASTAVAAGGVDAKKGGANNDGPYTGHCQETETCEESNNGNGKGKALGKPAAGSVGNADKKNPPGQLPGPEDRDNGYECDGNSGIARGNPAHSGCDVDDDHDNDDDSAPD